MQLEKGSRICITLHEGEERKGRNKTSFVPFVTILKTEKEKEKVNQIEALKRTFVIRSFIRELERMV